MNTQKLLLLVFAVIIRVTVEAQNTFPASGSVGIGTTSPAARLHISGGDLLLQNSGSGYPVIWMKDVGGTNVLRFDYNSIIHAGGDFYLRSGGTSNLIVNDAGNGGNVGIGTAAPLAPLHIRNTTDGDDQYSGIRFFPAKATAQATYPGENYHRISGFRRNGLWIMGSTSGSTYSRSNILFTDNGISLATSDGYVNPETNVKFFVSNGGNVGIGTTNPSQKLTVNGTIYGKEVKVDLSVPGPDYVFDKDYQLTSLEDIKTYIDQNKHLPEVPSAAAMEANGINLGEMNMLLLKKVEELTLYILNQQKQLESQQREINQIKASKN